MDPLVQLALFVRDLFGYDEQLIRIGRDNWESLDLDQNYIVIDHLADDRVYRSKKYDGDAENMAYTTKLSGIYTLDFYGLEALNNAQRFLGLNQSQQSHDLQRKLGITVNKSSSITNVKLLTSAKYHSRYQVEVRLDYNITTDVGTLRIDTADIQLIFNK